MEEALQESARDTYIEIVESYFEALDDRRVADVLDYFNEDAIFVVQSAFLNYSGRDSEIKNMFEGFLDSYKTVLHTDFEHIVDPFSYSISSRFRVELESASGSHDTKQSVNHWYLKNGKFHRVYVWISGDNVL